MEKSTIIEKLKKALVEREITESQIARGIGCTPAYINYLFSGKARYLPSDKFVNLAEKWLDKCWVCDTAWEKTKKGRGDDEV